MPKNIITFFLLLFSCAALVCCDLGNLKLTAQFNEIDNLASGDRILCQNQYIGNVGQISRTDKGQYLVKLDIDADYKKQLTVYSIFYIDKDPDRPDKKAIFTEQSRPGGILLTDNSVVVGLDSPPVLRHMLEDLSRKTEELASELAEKIGRARQSYEEQSKELARQMERALAEIDKQLRELERKVRTAPESDQVKELETNLDKMVDDLETRLGQVANSIGQDFSERLQESLDNLKRRLDELKRENRPSFQQERQKGEGGVKI